MAKFTKYNNPNKRRTTSRKPKRTFEEFLSIVHNMSLEDWLELNDPQKKALDMEYKDRYKQNL